MSRRKNNGPALKGPPKAETAPLRGGGGRPRQAGENRPGVLDYRLGVVGERSPGDEGEPRDSLERGEVRIPE